MSKISVYKASAGSGKTFRLTIEYLKIILARPSHYKKILAITFTNKATAEMKSRILSELHKLAQGEKSNYLAILVKELEFDETTIAERAKQAEQYILHDYSRFSVMTIDAFFQTILKAFAKELGVSYNYNVELDEERIRRMAVERMFGELSENKSLRNWLKHYVQDKIDEARSWNITNDIFVLSKELFQENLLFFDKKQVEKWNDKDFVQQLATAIHTYTQSYEKELQKLGKKAFEIIKNSGLSVDDFSRKSSGVAGLFEKLNKGAVFVGMLNSYHHKALNNPEGWYTKTAKPALKQQIEALFPTLNEILQQIFTIIEKKEPSFQSCKLVQQNLYLMGIFSDVARHIYEILHEEEKILLSESNKLLYELIAENDAPFIYEKTGNQFLYFLWDEFQDTSQVQWHNLKPLLSNALAEGNPCLIVGDVKQAIYRWRNSDWQILGKQISKEFPYIEEVTMQQNWRSDSRIIHFNNELFKLLPNVLEQQLEVEKPSLQTLYEDAAQEAMQAEEKGFVHFSYLAKQEELTDRELVLNELPKWVEKLQESGVKPEDIVFLVRKNSEAIAIADFFTNLEERKKGICYDVVSEFALLLENSLVVKVLVNALSSYHFQENYYSVFLENLMQYLPNGNKKFDAWKKYTERSSKNISIEQLVQKIIKFFGLNELGAEELYLMAFQEFVSATVEKQTNNLGDFLAIWEMKKNHLSVTIGEKIPAMQVMTAHKAKGLEFHTVILPFSDKNLDQILQGDSFWQETNTEPLQEAGTVLLPFSKEKLLSSTFAQAYKEEMHQRYIDELNVCYVATTRAVHNLLIIAPENERGTRLTALLYDKITSASEESFWKGWNEEKRAWTYGEIVASAVDEERKNALWEQKELYYQDYLAKFPLHTPTVDEAKRVQVDTLSPIEEGTIWHRLLENINYTDDIEKSVKQAYYSGVIMSASIENYISHLQKLLAREEIARYYTREYEVWNERKIWINRETYIPDRVVKKNDEIVIIEYKFGELHTNSHKKQLQKYIDFFAETGYLNIKGYLIYGVFLEIISI